MTDYERLKKLIEDTDALIAQDITNSDPKFDAWDLKVKRFFANYFGTDGIETKTFLQITFCPLVWTDEPEDVIHQECIDTCRQGLKTTKAILEAFLDDPTFEKKPTQQIETATTMDRSKIFIVHGHDGELKESVARIIEKQGIEAIILSEQANTGKTIIEKFEKYSDVGCAICLFTADDLGRAKANPDDKPRARQNVVFEAGYFIGKLGRDRIVILSDSGVEIPSDLAGVVYTNTRDWKTELLKELKAMGYTVDFNKLFE